jgi:hypothetical protein
LEMSNGIPDNVSLIGAMKQHLLGHTQVKTTQRYSHLTKDTLLDATNSVNTALSGMFVPMVSATPTAQVQLVP